MSRVIPAQHIVEGIRDALQYVSYFHPPDFIAALYEAWQREKSAPARDAIGLILRNSRLAALGRRPICQDTGMVVIFAEVGIEARLPSGDDLQTLVDQGVEAAYAHEENPLRASMIADPVFGWKNTGTNAPAILHVSLVPGNAVTFHVAAKGGGSENKARFAQLLPRQNLEAWVLDTVQDLGSGWCPPGLISVGVGGSAEKAMLMAKRALFEPIDMPGLRRNGPVNDLDAMRLRLFDAINNLGIGAQGMGGQTTIIDLKLNTYPTHAASMPVALIPQCAANRHIAFQLDGRGPAELPAPDLSTWPSLDDGQGASVRIDLNAISKENLALYPVGTTMLVSGNLLTARDAAHARIVDMLERGEQLPIPLAGRAIYYVGPVPAAAGEVIGPAGPTTSSRMDRYTDRILSAGVSCLIGKAERGPEGLAAIRRHGAPYLVAVGGAAYLISKSIRSARVVAFEDLGMEAIHEFEVVDMPVTVAIDGTGKSLHTLGPKAWQVAK